MMAMVLLSIFFIWAAQLFLFEDNYIQSAIGEVRVRLEPVMDELREKDLAKSEGLFPYLSQIVDGKMMLIDETGLLLAMYSYGHPMDLEKDAVESPVWKTIKKSEEYKHLLLGEPYEKVLRQDAHALAFEIGIPVLYNGKRNCIVLHHSLDEIQTVLHMNRNQFILLSILLTLAASVLAAVFSRHFTKPILIIKNSVDRMAQGDLTVAPGILSKDEIGQLSESVEKLGQALQRVDVLRKEVIANVSHELRSPLALISGYAEMVRDIDWKNERKREEDLSLIIREAKRMSDMVNDILDYSQFKAGYIHLKKDWYNLYEIVESEVNQCQQNMDASGIDICLAAEVKEIPVYVDALKISQVLRNMLNNAVNHTENHGTVQVSLEPLKQNIRVSVANPGPPIPQEERELIWERFQRSQHQGGRRQGTGLGLSIISTILTTHEMPYGVECQEGLNIFWFSCPIQKPKDSQE